jgi:hypothetical protein
MSMSLREWTKIPAREAVLVGACGGALGWYGPQFDLAAIAGVVLLARFRARVQSVVGALSFSLLALVSAMAGPRSPHALADLAQLMGAMCAIWLCALFAAGIKAAAAAPPGLQDCMGRANRVHYMFM